MEIIQTRNLDKSNVILTNKELRKFNETVKFNKAYTNPGSYLTIDTCLINNKHVLLTKFKKEDFKYLFIIICLVH